jgi:hypothetical protein
MDVTKITCENMDWVLMAKNRNKWRDLVDMAVNALLLEKMRNLLIE